MNASEMGYLIKVKPEEAKTRILAALREAKMHKGNAAAKLQCRHGTLIDWIKVLDLESTVERMIKKAIKEGWYHGKVGGFPKGKKRTGDWHAARGRTPKEPKPPTVKKKTKAKAA